MSWLTLTKGILVNYWHKVIEMDSNCKLYNCKKIETIQHIFWNSSAIKPTCESFNLLQRVATLSPIIPWIKVLYGNCDPFSLQETNLTSMI